MTFTLKLAKQLVCTTLRLVLYITVRGSGMLTDFCTYSLLCHGVPVSCQSAVSQLSGHRPFAIGNGHIHPAVTLSAQQQSSAKATLRRITLISHFPCYHGTLRITLISHFPCYHCTLGITDFTHFMVPLHTGAHWGTVKVKGPGSQRPDQVSGSRRSIRSDNLT